MMRFALFLILSLSSVVRAEGLCAGSMRADASGALIAYFEVLLGEGEIKFEDLRRMQNDLRGGKLSNPLRGGKAGAIIHRHAIEEYLRSGSVDSAQVLLWINETLAKKDEEDRSRNGVRDKTERSDWQMVFHRIEQQEVAGFVLPHALEVMETLVTQSMWVEIMRENKSHSAESEQAITVSIDGNDVRMLPDHPVEMISWIEAAQFANRLSIRDGYAPVYDLREIEAWLERSDRAEDGKPPAVPILAPDGDIYQTNGYRLPSYNEIDFLMQLVHTSYRKVSDFIWIDGNSEEPMSRPVGELRPFRIGGKDFFDLMGNVSIWTDLDQVNGNAAGVGPSFYTREINHRLLLSPWTRVHRDYDTGLRLVRTVK